MGWGYGILQDGREAGYTVKATCDHPGCDKEIDRGLAYACGNNHEAGDDYCADYFCYEHLAMTARGQRCLKCALLIPEEENNLNCKLCPHPLTAKDVTIGDGMCELCRASKRWDE